MFTTPFTYMAQAGGGTFSCVVQCFTTNGTWSCCTGAVCIEVVAIGGGAGGRSGIQHTAGSPGRSTGGPGGGAGGVSVCTLTSGFGTSQCVIIGGGGASDTSGSASCFGVLVCAGGGSVGNAPSSVSGVGSTTTAGGAGGAGNQGTSTAGGGTKACAGALGSPSNSAAPENSGENGASAAGFPGAGGGGGGFSQCPVQGWWGNGGAGAVGGTICGITLGSGGNGRTSSSQNFTERCGSPGTMPGGGGGGGGTNSSNTVIRDGGRGATGMVAIIQYIPL